MDSTDQRAARKFTPTPASTVDFVADFRRGLRLPAGVGDPVADFSALCQARLRACWRAAQTAAATSRSAHARPLSEFLEVVQARFDGAIIAGANRVLAAADAARADREDVSARLMDIRRRVDRFHAVMSMTVQELTRLGTSAVELEDHIAQSLCELRWSLPTPSKRLHSGASVRIKPSEVEEAILQVLSDRPQTSEEIGRRVGARSDVVRRSVGALRRMGYSISCERRRGYWRPDGATGRQD